MNARDFAKQLAEARARNLARHAANPEAGEIFTPRATPSAAAKRRLTPEQQAHWQAERARMRKEFEESVAIAKRNTDYTS